MKKSLYFLYLIFIFTSCSSEVKKTINVQDLIDKSISVSGKDKFKNYKISFDFRDYHYVSKGFCDYYVFERTRQADNKFVKDIYSTNKSLVRLVDKQLVNLSDSLAHVYTESINSVFYFVQLPFRLNDKAVLKSYVGIDSLGGKFYHKVYVTFRQEDGGTDYNDKFMYWINSKTHQIDFLAYKYTTNGGGVRFREAINERYRQGIRFVDYINYKPKDSGIELGNLLKVFNKNNLIKVSVIKNKNIKVSSMNSKC